MDDSFWRSDAQMARIEPYYPLSHGIARVDDRRVLSGIVHVIRTGMRWRDAPPDYGPHKTLYNRFVRWSRLGVFDRIFAALAGQAGEPDLLMINATHLKAHRTAASLFKKGLWAARPCCFASARGPNPARGRSTCGVDDPASLRRLSFGASIG